MNLSDSKKKLALAGVVCGLVAMCLAIYGNPANMAFCIGCFIRDMAGSLGMHQAEAVQYARPEIIGLVLGAFLISFATKEYRSTGGSSPMIRFVLGIVIMVGSLVFLGCPLRMILRMSAGDGNAWVGLIGFILGVSTGAFALKKGFSLGRAYVTNKTSGMVLPALMVGVLLLSIFTTLLKSSESGPGSMHAPLILSLIGGLIFGAFFMATDYVTSPITPMGQIVFGIMLGLLTGIFRLWGASPEGVSYAIILCNLFVPMIERVTLPKAFGKEAEKA